MFIRPMRADAGKDDDKKNISPHPINRNISKICQRWWIMTGQLHCAFFCQSTLSLNPNNSKFCECMEYQVLTPVRSLY